MKNFIKKWLIIAGSVLAGVIILVVIFDKLIMPWYVDAKEVKLPNLVGLHKSEAENILKKLHLNVREIGPRYDPNFDIDHVIFQRPPAGTIVKENRRVYLHISGGDPLIKMPNLINKTLRDAKVTLERRGLYIRDIIQVKSELKANHVVEQEFVEGTNLAEGDSVDLKVSIGPRVGMVRVPNLIGKSLSEVEIILRRNNLKMGIITYKQTPSILTNTVIEQLPSEDFLLSVGDSVDVTVAKSISSSMGPN
jgi:serine/threonine-protein kinase